MSHKLSNTYNEAMGGAKEKIGHATHSEQMASAGAAQKADAQVNQQHQKAQTHAHGAGQNIQGETLAGGRLTNDQALRGGEHVNDQSLRAGERDSNTLGDARRTY
ncbi:hypothetical protein BGW39_000505 [Mortierella sp. 14UC]|nr:hypothetical protein BGW39_000505 [Mortierella sp. 14UC]